MYTVHKNNVKHADFLKTQSSTSYHFMLTIPTMQTAYNKNSMQQLAGCLLCLGLLFNAVWVASVWSVSLACKESIETL